MTERKKAGLTQQQCASKFEVPEAAWGISERRRNTRIGRILEMINMAARPKALEIIDVNRPPKCYARCFIAYSISLVGSVVISLMASSALSLI